MSFKLLVVAGLFSSLSSSAYGFCGTYVGGAGAELTSRTSQVALVRMDNRTILTMANDVSGDTSNFALVVPVPEVLNEEAVKVLDPTIFQRLQAYSEPRLVKYECEDFEQQENEMDADTDADTDSDSDTDTDVDVEAEFVVGEYEIVILSASESSALVTWLRTNNYDVPSTSTDLLGEYIDGGSYFFAAKVDEEKMLAPGQLRPLQFGYETDVFGLPIRLGTLSSPGEQDLVLYSINDHVDGHVGIANYPEVTIEDECLFDTYTHGTFGDFYETQFENAYLGAGDGAWSTEYAWNGGKCDPCTGTQLDGQDLVNLGWDPWRNYFFTRNRMRFTPEQADEDLVLYSSGRTDQEQLRYIQYAPTMEDRWPVCWQGWAEDPGSCTPGEPNPSNPNAKTKGCSSIAHPVYALWGIAFLLSVRRYRRD